MGSCKRNSVKEWGGVFDNIATKKKKIPSPKISHVSGFYKENILVTLSARKKSSLYYTLDGTTPDERSNRYEKPLFLGDRSDEPNKYANRTDITLVNNQFFPEYPIPKSTILKVISIDNSGNKSDVSQCVYFFDFDNKTGYNLLPTISLSFDTDDLFSYDKGIYILGQVYDNCKEIQYQNYAYTCPSNYNSEGRGWRREVNLSYFDECGRLLDEITCEAEIHGGWSRANTQKSFNLLGINSKVLNQFFGRTVDSLVLHAGQNHESVVLDKVTQDLVNDRFILTQQALLCQVFLNGEYWGVYLLQDRISKDFISDKYGVNEDNILLVKNVGVVNDEQDYYKLYTDVIDFAVNHDLSLEDNYNELSKMIDIQSYIDYVAVEVYIGNCDSFNNNYACWRTKKADLNNSYADNKWRWILYDTEVGCRLVSNDMMNGDSFRYGGWSTKPTELPLFSSLLKNDGFKTMFANSFLDIANRNYSSGNAKQIIENILSNDVVDAIVKHNIRFTKENYSLEDFTQKKMALIQFFEERGDYILPKLKSEIYFQ